MRRSGQPLVGFGVHPASVTKPRLPFGCFFGVMSLSLILADFGTFCFVFLADRFDAGMALVSFHSILAVIPIHDTSEFALINVIECKL